MRIITLNANGIRSAGRKGFFAWLETQNADVVCIQETKAQTSQLQDALYFPSDYQCMYEDAEKPGYSGVAIYSRHPVQQWLHGIGDELIDREGRYLEAQFPGLSVISLYAPSGSSSEERQAFKFRFMDVFLPHLLALRDTDREYIICGDWNIAHQAIDLKNWRSNQKNSGFLPEERAWLDKLFNEHQYCDAFRLVEPAAEQYTWWSNRGRAWENNVGWRIDYQVISAGLKDKVQSASIYTETRFSDHAPLIMDYRWQLPA